MTVCKKMYGFTWKSSIYKEENWRYVNNLKILNEKYYPNFSADAIKNNYISKLYSYLV